jgi:SSS family solute:Na+ symporter
LSFSVVVVSVNSSLVALILYSASFIAVGLFVARRVKRADDFLVAGRRLGPALLASSFLAANIGAGSTVGATGLGYLHGWSAWWWVGCAGIGSLILANTIGPKVWKLAADNGWRTVGDYLDWRYNRSVRGLVASLLWLGTLMILAGQLIAISQILTVVVGTPKWQGCLIGGLVVSAYVAAGGLLSSSWVNTIQLTVKLSGFALAVPFGLAAVGGWSNLQPTFHSTAPLGATGILTYMAILIPAFVVSPGLVQKLYGARDARTVRIAVNVNAVVLLAFAFVPVILGVIARSRFPGLSNGELALPMVLTKVVPPWIGLLTLAAVFSAEVSASDAILFMLSSSLSIDLYKSFVRPKASDEDILFVGRVAALVGAGIAILLAIWLTSIIAALQVFYTLMGAALAAPFVIGLYGRRATARRAVFAIVVSVAITALVRSGPWGILAGFFVMLLP